MQHSLTQAIAQAPSRLGFVIFMFDMKGRGDTPATISSSGFSESLNLQRAFDYLVSSVRASIEATDGSRLFARSCSRTDGRMELEQLQSGRCRSFIRRFFVGPTKFHDRHKTTAYTQITQDLIHGEVDRRNRHQQNFTRTFDNPLRC